MIDLARLIAGYAPAVAASPATAPSFVSTLLSSSGRENSSWPSSLTKAVETNLLLSLRAFANLFQGGAAPGLGDWESEVSSLLNNNCPGNPSLNDFLAFWRTPKTLAVVACQDTLGGAGDHFAQVSLRVSHKSFFRLTRNPCSYSTLVLGGASTNAVLVALQLVQKVCGQYSVICSPLTNMGYAGPFRSSR